MRKKYISILFLMFAIFLFIFANNNLSATKNGLNLWIKNVVPSLFPFFIATNLLSYSSVPYYLSKYSNNFVRKVFNLPGIAAFPFIMGIISGSPIGAKITCDLYKNKIITKKDAEKIICFTNNSSPLFIIGTVGISFYSSTVLGICMLICHVLSAITVGIFVGKFNVFDNKFSYNTLSYKNNKKFFWHFKQIYQNQKSAQNIYNNSFQNIENDLYLEKLNHEISTSSLGKILASSIFEAIKSILLVGGFVTLFSIIISMLQQTNILPFISVLFSKVFGIKKELINGFLCGILEFTNGLNAISKIPLKNISLKLILSSFLLGFGGLSVFFQVIGITSSICLSSKKYLKAKILQGLIAAFYTFLILQIPMLNFNL